MRRILLVLALGFVLAIAGCASDTIEDEEPDVGGEDVADHAEDVEFEAESENAPAREKEPDRGLQNEAQRDRPPPEGELEIHHIDVGQGDATLIVTPENETILFDTGNWPEEGEAVIDYLEERHIDRIDHLIATHAHADHIGGHASVIEWAETEGEGIGAAYDSGVPHTTGVYDDYLDAIEEHDVEFFTVLEGDILPLNADRMNATFLNPAEGENGEDLHYNSIALVLEFGNVTYLTTGDAEADAEERMVDEWADELSSDVYQAGHHGSSTSSTEPFLDEVDPRVAVISSAYDSQYGHPDDVVLERFAEMGIETYWTGVHGDVVVTTDGEDIEVEPVEDASTDPQDLLDAKPVDDEDADPPEDDSPTDDEVDETPTDDRDVVAEAIDVADLQVEGVSPDEEHIILENTGEEPLELGEWQIRDREEDGQVARGLDPFAFPSDFVLHPGEEVTIWTGEGEDTDTDLYWGYGVNIWRADGDVIILMDPDDVHVFEYAYGDQE